MDANPDANQSCQAEKYSAALELMQYHIQVLWGVFGLFLVAETVLLGALAQVFVGGPTPFVLAGSLVGLLLVIPWWTTFEYNRAFYLLRVEQAKKHEPVDSRFLAEGGDLAHGKPVPYLVTVSGGNQQPLTIGPLIRFIGMRYAGLFLILVFGASFVGIAIYKLRLCGA